MDKLFSECLTPDGHININKYMQVTSNTNTSGKPIQHNIFCFGSAAYCGCGLTLTYAKSMVLVDSLFRNIV